MKKKAGNITVKIENPKDPIQVERAINKFCSLYHKTLKIDILKNKEFTPEYIERRRKKQLGKIRYRKKCLKDGHPLDAFSNKEKAIKSQYVCELERLHNDGVYGTLLKRMYHRKQEKRFGNVEK